MTVTKKPYWQVTVYRESYQFLLFKEEDIDYAIEAVQTELQTVATGFPVSITRIELTDAEYQALIEGQ